MEQFEENKYSFPRLAQIMRHTRDSGDWIRKHNDEEFNKLIEKLDKYMDIYKDLDEDVYMSIVNCIKSLLVAYIEYNVEDAEERDKQCYIRIANLNCTNQNKICCKESVATARILPIEKATNIDVSQLNTECENYEDLLHNAILKDISSLKLLAKMSKIYKEKQQSLQSK